MNKIITKCKATIRSQSPKRLFCSLLVLATLIGLLSTAVFAAWDGQGANGDENTSSSIIGDYSLAYANENDILGYRFTVYDSAGEKLGFSIDIDRKTHSYDTLWRSCYGSKRSHIDLYRLYLSTNGGDLSLGYVSSTDSDKWVYFDSTLPSTPTEVENWISETKAIEIARDYCETADYDYATSYMIVEPIIVAKLNGDYYAMTMAEYAVYQSDLYGWDSYGDKDAGVSGTYRYNLMRPLSGYFGRYLYAVYEYPVLGTTYVPPSALKDDARGTPSVLFGSNTRYNTAADVLMYQVGMAVYTGVAPTNTNTLTVDPNGGTWEGSTSAQAFEMVEGETKTLATPIRSGYTFTGWNTKADGTGSNPVVDGVYTQGASDCTIYAQWAPAVSSITFNYYSNYADTLNGSAIDSSNQVFLVSWTVTANDSFPTSHWDYTPSNAAYALTRDGYIATGYWGTSPTGGTLMDQNYGMQSYADLCEKYGISVDAKSTTINLYAQWTPEAETFTNTIQHWTWGYENGEGNNGSGNAYFLRYTYFDAIAGSSYVVDANMAISLPRGFYVDGWGSNQFAGSWTEYEMGTEVTQPDMAVDIQFNYRPYDYTITYDTNGGTIKESGYPTSYNILYGQTFPTNMFRRGYTFAGWLVTTEPKTVSMIPGAVNYIYTSVLRNVIPGTAYTVHIDEARLLSGSAANYTVLIYDFTDGEVLAETVGSFGSDVSVELTCPADADASHDIQILIYSGLTGATSNNVTVYNDLTVSYEATGINEGEDAEFVAADPTEDAFRAELNTRYFGDITVTAQWEPNTITIYLDKQGGSGGISTVYEVYAEKFYFNPYTQAATTWVSVPTRTGYTFGGYYTSKEDEGTPIIDASGNILVTNTYFTANARIYAKWTPVTYTITYDEAGGSAVDDLTYTILDAVTLADAPTRTGYTFAGWALETAAGNWEAATYTAAQALEAGKYGSITLVAQWTPVSYTITYDENGGSEVADLNYDIEDAVTLAEAPNRTGYTFEGWKLATASGSWVADTYDASEAIGTGKYGNITLVAQWTPKAYTITYDEAGGSSIDDLIYDIEDAVTLSAAPTKTGYAFAGWKLETPAGNWVADTYDASEAIGAGKYGSITLVAQWTPVSYTITYDENGGSEVADLNYDIEDAVTLAEAPNRTGYTFTGWKLETASGSWSADTYDASEAFAAGKYGNITLEAQWTPNTNTKYVVNHFQMNTSGSYPATPFATETLTGTTGETLTLSNLAKTYTGFTYSHGQVLGATVPTATILADGSRVINLYYSRNLYTVTLDKRTGIADVAGARAYYYGQSVTIDATVAEGYIWDKWIGDHETSTKAFTFTMPANDVEMIATAIVARDENATLRFIKDIYFETLLEASKWRQDPLMTLLTSALSEDLSNDENCEQVWEFSSDEFDALHEFCSALGKGEDAIEAFLEKYRDEDNHRVK